VRHPTQNIGGEEGFLVKADEKGNVAVGGMDAIKYRKLVGMGQLPDDIEAYVLQSKKNKKSSPEYATIVWRRGDPEETGPYKVMPSKLAVVDLGGFRDVVKVLDWKLDEVAYDKNKPVIQVGDAPLIVYSSSAPDWKLISRQDWIKSAKVIEVKTGPVVSGK
jgi:hypothetical protein